MKQAEVIFVVGATIRTGTNFLGPLLALHPDCAIGDRVGEDHLLENLVGLDTFVSGLSEWWTDRDSVRTKAAAELRHDLLRELVAFLRRNAKPPARPTLILKTPNATGMERFAEVPGAKLLALVRDGRSVVESARLTAWPRPAPGQSDFATVAEWWRDGVRIILEAERRGVDFLLVRYEDLVARLRPTLSDILAHVGLDIGRYDFAAADNLPVRGSSVFRGGVAKTHWEPVAKTPDFRPLARWRETWTEENYRMFSIIASEEMQALGYGD